MTRAEIEVETLLKIVLVLAIIWLAVRIVDVVVGELVFGVLELFEPFLGLIIVLLIVLWLLDQL